MYIYIYIYNEPNWVGMEVSAGSWEQATREGGGEQDADKVVANGHTGHFGVLAANWGGKWKDECLDNYMNDDIRSATCQVIVLQEAEPGFWSKMAVRSQRAKESLGQGGCDDITPHDLLEFGATKENLGTAF